MNLLVKEILISMVIASNNSCVIPLDAIINSADSNVEVQYADKHTLGFDVSDVEEQADLKPYVDKGGEFVVIRTSRYRSDDERYGSDNAKEQIQSAKQYNLQILAYHASYFSDSKTKAVEEAEYAVQKAKEYGIEEGSYLACDYELNATHNKANNTEAIIAFMEKVRDSGYRPLLYTGLKYATKYVDIDKIVKEFGTCIWLANYPKLGEVEKPNIKALEKLKVKGVLLYQYTDNWYGLLPGGDADGDVSKEPIVTIVEK